jgi:hypothetical protein
MTITNVKFSPKSAPKRGGSNKRNKLFNMNRRIIFQNDPTRATDELGSRPYSNYTDYLIGNEGGGYAASIESPHADDILLAAQHGMVISHSILVRYDARIDPRMIIRYTNNKTGESTYWWVKTITNVDFEWNYMRIGADEILDYGDDE